MKKDFTISDYQIHLPALGEGAFGTVYRATYRGISDRALKIFRPETVDLSTMARELEKLSSVAEHHGIVTLHDFDLLSDSPYYAMGLHADSQADGSWKTRTLESLEGNTDPREAWRLIREISDALAYLHRNQIIHCDVKPSNILLTDENPTQIKLCDFGQSRTEAVEIVDPAGTPLYASPEQLRDPRDSAEGKGFRWDVYSFGVVAYKLVTGEFPRLNKIAASDVSSFDLEATIAEADLDETIADGSGLNGETLANLIESEEEIKWPEHVRLSPDRKELIEHCLRTNPRKRYADMREVWNLIKNIDHQRVVGRALRLNILFAALLFVAVWATGFAFVQAKKTREAIEESQANRQKAEELVLFIINNLNSELSRTGQIELLEHIGDNAGTYLENLSIDQTDGQTLLRLSANTTAMKGEASLRKGDLEDAYVHLQNAYEIHSKLLEEYPDDTSLAALTSNDLMGIAQVLDRQNKYDDAIEQSQLAYELRTNNLHLSESIDPLLISNITKTLTLIATLHQKNGSPEDAVDTYKAAIKLYLTTAQSSDKESLPIFLENLIAMTKSLSALQLDENEIEDARESMDSLSEYATELATLGPEYLLPSQMAKADNNRFKGQIYLGQNNKATALRFFGLENSTRREIVENSHLAEHKIKLAESYDLIASCQNLLLAPDRTVATNSYQEAVWVLESLPSAIKKEEVMRARIADYREKITQLLEMDE